MSPVQNSEGRVGLEAGATAFPRSLWSKPGQGQSLLCHPTKLDRQSGLSCTQVFWVGP